MLRVTTPMGLRWIVFEDSTGQLWSCPVSVSGWVPVTSKRNKVEGLTAELFTGYLMPAAMDRLRELVHEAGSASGDAHHDLSYRKPSAS